MYNTLMLTYFVLYILYKEGMIQYVSICSVIMLSPYLTVVLAISIHELNLAFYYVTN